VGFVIDGSETDGGWNQSNYDDALKTCEQLGLSQDQYVIMTQVDPYSSDAESAFEMLVSDGCKLIFGMTSSYTDAITAVSQRHPDVYFAQFEGKTSDNCVSYSCNDYNTIAMCGYAVALTSKQDQLGFIACQPQASIIRACDAFSAGAKYANPNAKVKVMWINSWFDIEKEKEATNSLIDEGMNAIGYYGGTTAPQAACEEAGCYTNGFTLDYLEYGPDAVVTSFVFNWVPILTEIINRVQNNQWSNETVYYGIKEGACSCSAFNSKTLSADQIAKCETVYESIKNGELDFTKGPIYDNKGNCVLEDGKNFTMNDSLSMSFLIDNVIGDLPQ